METGEPIADSSVSSAPTSIPRMTVEVCAAENVDGSEPVDCTLEIAASSSQQNAVDDDVGADDVSDTLRIVHLDANEAPALNNDEQANVRQAELGHSLSCFRGDNESFSSFSSTGTDLSMCSAAVASNNSPHTAVVSSGISSNCTSNGSSKTATLQYSSERYSPPPSGTSARPTNFYLNAAALHEQALHRTGVAVTSSSKEANTMQANSGASAGSFLRQVFSWATKKETNVCKTPNTSSTPSQLQPNATFTASRSADFSLFGGGSRTGTARSPTSDEVASTLGLILESRPV